MLGPQDNHEEVQESTPVQQETLVAPAMPDDIDRLTIARALRIENLSEMKEHQRRFDKILKWAHEKGAKSEVDLLGEISSLRNRLGNPTIYDISVYVGLELEKMALMKHQAEVDSKISKFQK